MIRQVKQPWFSSPHSLLLLGCLTVMLTLPQQLFAESATLEVFYLPLQEAEAVVKSQLSERGSVTTLTSRRILIINDTPERIREAKKLLKQLDVVASQYTLYLEIIRLKNGKQQSLDTTAKLPGGWVKLAFSDQKSRSSRRQSFNLRLTGNQQGSIETGTIQPYQQTLRQWLAGYGLISVSSVEMLSLTSGFFAEIRPANAGNVRIQIEPWVRDLRADTNVRGETEILFGLGSITTPKQPPSNQAPIRYNASPVQQGQNKTIEITGAATALTIPLGKTVTIVAIDQEAELLGRAMLSTRSNIGSNRFAIKIRVEQQ